LTTLTARYRFSASHRLYLSSLSDEENSQLFGKCSNPYGHGHDYVLSVTVRGEVDPQTGLMIRKQDLDRLVDQAVLRNFSHRNLNVDIAEMDELVPTTENVTLVIARLLQAAWRSLSSEGSGCRLWAVHLQETDRNGFEIRLNDLRRQTTPISINEGMVLHV